MVSRMLMKRSMPHPATRKTPMGGTVKRQIPGLEMSSRKTKPWKNSLKIVIRMRNIVLIILPDPLQFRTRQRGVLLKLKP